MRTLSDFVTRRRFRHTGLYDELYRRIGGEYLAALQLPLAPPLVVGFGLFRSHRDFSARERRLLAVLQPRLAHAYEQVVRRVALGTLEAVIEEGKRGVIVLAANGRPAYLSPHAAARLEAWFGTANRPILPPVLERWLASDADRQPLVVERDGERLVARIHEEPGSRAVVLTELRTKLEPASLRELGLSRREAEVLSLVAAGGTNAGVARDLSVSPRTVKKHLESVYEKLGVHTRAAAVSAALAGRG